MADWYLRITSKRRQELDQHLLVQAVLAMARLLEKRQLRGSSGETTEAPR